MKTWLSIAILTLATFCRAPDGFAQTGGDLGMAMSQVRARAGAPDAVVRLDGGTVQWTYHGRDGVRYVYIFEAGRVSLMMAVCEHASEGSALNELTRSFRSYRAFGFRVAREGARAIALDGDDRRVMLGLVAEPNRPFQHVTTLSSIL